jgi:hypothetical protein
MTIFNSLLFAIVAVLILANLALLVAAVFWAMGGLVHFTRVQRPSMVRASSAPFKPLLRH